jgi:serine/threonine protein kinase
MAQTEGHIMASNLSCGDGKVLSRFLLGQMPEAEARQVEHHLDGCGRCVDTLQELRVHDTLYDAVRQAPTVSAAPVPPAIIDAMIEQASRLATCVDSADDAATQEVYRFLAPAQGPGELGRLGAYRVLKLLGSGGMGVVFEAEDTQLKRRVALKVMKPALASHSSGRRRFLREAQAAASVKHDHVVTIYQVGEDPTFLAMELLQGESLSDRLQRQGSLPVAEVIRLGRQVAQGLAAVHERGLVHRDIKPSNIWLEAHGSLEALGSQSVGLGRVKILDFGIARLDQGDATATGTGQVVGTPAYIAPEQARGEKADHRADLFSLGCVLYHLCTGRLPFRGETSLARLTSLAVDSPESVQRLAADVPPALADLIMRLLAKAPAQRPPSAQAVVAELAAIEAAVAEQVFRKPAPRTRRRRLLVGVAAAIVLLAATWPVAQVIIRIRYPDGTEKNIPAPPGTMVQVIENPGRDKGKPSPFDAFQRDQIPTEDLAAAGAGDAKNAPAELVGFLKGHSTDVVSLALHPNGKHLLSGDQGGTVAVWDLDARKLLQTYPGERTVNTLTFSATGDRLATTLWTAGPAVFESIDMSLFLKRPVRRFPLSTVSVALSPDGRRLAANGGGGAIQVLDVDSGDKVLTLIGHTGRIDRILFSQDGQRLASASADGTVRIWEARTGKELQVLQKDGMSFSCLALSADGKSVAAGGNGRRIVVWEVATGEERNSCDAGEIRPLALCFSHDSSLLAAGMMTHQQAGKVAVWQARTGELVREWVLPGILRTVLFAPDGRHLLYGNADGSIHVLRLRNSPSTSAR